MDGKKLKSYLQKRGVKANALPQALGVSRQTIYNVFNENRKQFSMEEAMKLKIFLRMTDSEFKDLFGQDEWYGLYAKGAKR